MTKRKRRIAWGRVIGAAACLIIFCVLSVSACKMLFSGEESAEQPQNSQQMVESKELQEKKARDEAINKQVDEIMEKMSRTEKLGQLMMIGIHGKDVNEDNLYMLRQFHFGGVILFDRNMESKEQVAVLNKHLQEQCDEKAPLFIAVDEEGGSVARMKSVLIPPPDQLKLGETGDPQNAKKSAYNISKELKAMGFNVNFAPVADLGSTNGKRHFSSDPQVTANFVSAAANGYEEVGVFYTLKHFPGIGSGATDSHDDSVVVDVPKSELLNKDIVPFKTIIDSHDPEKFCVMVSHVTYPQIDGNTPASISSVIMNDILRKELGFCGIIVTDDMEMGAIANHYGFRRAAVEAIKGGADIVLMCHEYEHEQDAYMGLLDALNSGELSQERVDESVRRILRAKIINIK